MTSAISNVTIPIVPSVVTTVFAAPSRKCIASKRSRLSVIFDPGNASFAGCRRRKPGSCADSARAAAGSGRLSSTVVSPKLQSL
ncbi:hypothetical protein LZC13_09340, partial [Campylobacter coli]|nr:hypothetical protein [Campylobacter coli]